MVRRQTLAVTSSAARARRAAAGLFGPQRAHPRTVGALPNIIYAGNHQKSFWIGDSCPLCVPEGAMEGLMGITLDRKTVATLALPQGRTEQFFWDEQLKGFSLRLRVGHDGKLMRSWYVTYRINGKQYRPKLADLAKLNADQARKRATEMLAKVGSGPRTETRHRRSPYAAPSIRTSPGRSARSRTAATGQTVCGRLVCICAALNTSDHFTSSASTRSRVPTSRSGSP